MQEPTTQDLIRFFETTIVRDIPFLNSQMVAAVKQSSKEENIGTLEKMLDSMTNAYVRLNPEKSRETMIKNARETFATLAYLADHNPSPEGWKAIGPIDAYAHECDYGRAMSLVRKIFDLKKIDLMRDVFSYEK